MGVSVDSFNIKQLNDLIARAQQRNEFLNSEKAAKGRAKRPKPRDSRWRNRSAASQAARAKPRASAGRGKRTRWFNAAFKAGKKENDPLIK